MSEKRAKGEAADRERLEKWLDRCLRLDCYRDLLTERQVEVMVLVYEEDYSLSEVAELWRTSRQAVHDLLRRSEALLDYYEGKLHLAELGQQRQSQKEQIELLLLRLQGGQDADGDLWRQLNELIAGL